MDAGERRELVADALFRVVARDGLHGASLRSVAAEADLNLGSVRHYFAGQSDLMRFAMRTLVDRVAARMAARVEAIGDPGSLPADERVDAAVDLFAELLPLDARRHDEVVVFLEFSAAARRDPGLADLERESTTGTDALVRRALTASLGAGRDLDTEADRLAALLDGLSLAGTRAVDPVGPARCRAALRAHLLDLRAPAG
ncbi:TetR family transcriptional regulator [Pseudonocardia endophytica]|uniref:TetR family transcriptional regulator n=1 Tax=Pseudonocardia endophytica TaxID=401976 RepID=A0A4R1IBJ0_PSEEN|nr:TetR family transcriptional regulator [Pseudonocardia endophytica]